MIRAALYKDASGQLTGFTASGHAGYAKRDRDDIVCAAVSVLGATVVNSLEALCGISTDTTVIENDNGLLTFRLPGDLDLCQIHDAQILMRTLLQGLTDVEEQYPKHLRLVILPAQDP